MGWGRIEKGGDKKKFTLHHCIERKCSSVIASMQERVLEMLVS